MRFSGVAMFFLTLSSSAVKAVVGQSVCSNALAGIETAGICCPESCGACGGSGCRTRPGGDENCCTGYIASNGALCSESTSAPCIVDDATVGESTCSNGLAGVGEGNVCCEESCGSCGGSGCKNLPGGRDSCCMGAVEDAGVLCSVSGAAPCIIDDAPVEDTFCSNGMAGVESASGDICCGAGCGTCGGNGCKNFPGGKENCCTGSIFDEAVLCSVSGAAPCIVDNDVVTDPTCSNGLTGIQTKSTCCLEECGECGGVGCGSRDGGPEGCCTSVIADFCNTTMAAPCVVV